MARTGLMLFTSAVLLALHEVSGARSMRELLLQEEEVTNRHVMANTRSEDMYCCCKENKCEVDAVADDETHDAVYNPQHNLCCKFKSWPCNHIFAFSAYKTDAPSKDYCEAMQDDTLTGPSKADEDAHEVVHAGDLTPGTNEHTVHTYCELSREVDREDKEAEPSPDTTAAASVKAGLVRALVTELSNNSMDSMAKEMFSLYLCVRWAPSADFVRAGNSEIATGKLDNSSSVLEHYAAHRFTPLRCTRNVNVYGNSPALGQSHFSTFEAEMQALALWYRTEAGSTLSLRLEEVQESKDAKLNRSAAAFDVEAVRRVVAGCPRDAKILVNVQKASTSELLSDCGAARWWLSKLQDWHRAMPFTSFMMPDAAAAEEAHAERGEQVLVCFGKRVASQLHRRDGGDHLMTDQSMVGCHGFWDLPMAAKMLDRIVQLWRPPTCQLAAMELDMKMKIMDLTASMNNQLFDALPAMLVDEMSSVPDADGKALQASHGISMMGGVWNSIVSAFSGLRGKYARLGQLLGNTVTKWVVCPVRPISNMTELQQLDMALGTEDSLAQYYSKIAYSKWTGEKDLLPGEDCNREDADNKLPGLPRARHCSLGVMRENTPEPYPDEEFLCPVRPLLPAKQQLDIFKKKHHMCMMRMNTAQMMEENWFYRGRTPQRKQYNVTENIPSQKYQYMKILGVVSRPDTEFAIWRNFVSLGHRCTEEEMALTSRWCSAPEVANEPSVAKNLLTGIGVAGGVLGGVARSGLESAGVVEETPSNKASGERLGAWLYGQAKGFEKWFKSSGEWVGRASTRYERRYSRAFEEVEANELLHSASFQSALDKAGEDSKDLQKFDRYAVVTRCENFDPAREFNLKYYWSEKAINLARKAHQKFGDVLSGGAFFVQLRGSGILQMQDEENAWMTYYTHLRAAKVGAAAPDWIGTKNPYLQEMSGALDGGSGSVSASSLLGFQATFACGSRLEMHDLPREVEARQGNFGKCVKEGKAKNDDLRAKHPGEPFLREETVIRVTFAPLQACYTSLSPESGKNVNETKNPVFANFKSISGCKPAPAEEAPEDLRQWENTATYRGMLLGKGLPKETLVEVLVDPGDFLMEVQF